MKALFDYLKPITQKIDAKWAVPCASELGKNSSKKITLASTLLLSAGTILGVTSQQAVAQTNPSYPNFDQRYNVEIPGNLEAIGNASVICDRNNPNCADGLANGTRGNNNGGLAMQMLDIDSDGSTFNSSSAQLNLPAGVNVRFAALYWGGSLSGFGTTPAPNPNGFNQVSLQAPGSGTYQTITANSQNDRTDFGQWRTYGAFADITTLVQGAGNGTYTVANVQSNVGAGFTYPNAGWSIVVVYEDPAQPLRNISIFDGHNFIQNNAQTATLNGLRTPPTAGFEVFMGAIGNDGEVDQTGDFLRINTTNITDALNPANNFFNGTISKFGNHVTSRTPNDPFNMVFDIDYLDLTSWNQANNAIPTNATSIDLTLDTQGDGIWPLAYFFAVQVFEPNLVTQFEKTTPQTSYANGDTIPYTINVTNTGNDNSRNTVITDAIPAGTTYVPGSLKIGGVAQTDGAGDDEAEFDGSNVVFRVGTGANASQGGQLNINDAVTTSFDVTVTAAPGQQVCNQATIAYEGATSGNAASGNSDDPNTPQFGDCTEITTTASAAKDYGDAPDTYGTNDASSGPSHTIVSGIHLGTAPDSESDAQTPLNGSGDGAEDDGITLATLTEGDTSYTIPAGNITATGTGTLHAWLDFDKSGTFEPGEYTSVAVTSGTPAGDLAWSGITAGAAGNTYARFRFTSDASINANTPGGEASDGEVEDYQVAIAAPSFDISGTLYVDSNGNDIFENPTGGGSEAPMPENITVRLLSSDGSTELATTVTDTSGSYSFPDIVPGTYQVAVETTDPDIPIGHNIGTPTPLTISLTSADAIAQDFGFDLTTTGGEVTFCQSPNGEVYSGGINRDIYAIYPSTGATFRVTTTALAGVVNSLATDHFYRVAYYAEGQAIYAWDPINDTHVRLQDSNGNLNVSAMPGGGSISSLTSGGAAFFNGSYYLGIERAQGNSNTEVYRVDFVPGSNGLVIQSLTALGVNDNTGGANGGLNSADWGDMIISDAGVIYAATRRAGFTWSFDLSTSVYNQISNNYLGQLAKDGEGVLWGLSDTSRIQRVDINTGSLFGPSSPTSSPIADMGECVVGLSTIGDRIWDDLDGDGVQDPLEPGIANVTVGIYRDLNGNGIIDTAGSPTIQDPLLTTQVTNSSGNYDFVDLIRGTYIVKVLEGTADDLDGTNVLDGAVLTTTSTTPGGQQAVTIPLGINDYNDADFGYQLPIIPKDPNVLLVKRITQINGSTSSAGGDDLSGYIDQGEVINPYDDNDITVADPVAPTDPPKDTNLWPTPLTTTLVGGIDGGNVMPNDEIEYTIYYLSSGDATAENVLFCDYVPTFTSYIPNAYTGSVPQATGGIGGADLSIELFRNGTTDYHTGANDGDSATYFAPGADPATSFPGIDCDGDSDGINANANGAVVVNLGDLPDATTNATGAYGYVRFRARVK